VSGGVSRRPLQVPPTSVPPGATTGGPAGQDGGQPGNPAAKAVRAAAGKLGQAASDAAALARQLAPADEDDGRPVSRAAELKALKSWAGHHRGRAGGQFVCEVLTRADAPHLAADQRIVFKDGGGQGKALAGTGPAGRGTRTS
jgi:hypothetical protein